MNKNIHTLNTNKEILSFVNGIERKLSKDDAFFYKTDFWPVIRLQLIFKIIQGNQKKINQEKRILFLETLLKRPKIKKPIEKVNQLFITHKNYLIDINGENYDRVMEKIIRDVSSPLILDLSDNSLKTNNNESSFSNISIQIFFAKILGFLLGNFLYIFHKKKFKTLESLMCIDSNYKNPIINSNSIAIRVSYIWVLSKYITYFLKKFKIDNVYQGMYYDNFGLATSLASHKEKITNNCVQHGGQSKNNPVFGSWKILTKEGSEFLPDNFLCWDIESSKSIESWVNLSNKHKTRIIGYGWIDLWNEELKKNHIFLDQKTIPNILITLQPSIELKKSFLYGFIKKSNLEVNWIIRVHPRQESPEFINSLEEHFEDHENVYIKSSKDLLPALMVRSNLHITHFSSSIYEAIFCNVKSVIIDKRGLDYFYDLIENNLLHYVDNEQDLKNLIIKMLDDEKK